MSNGARAQLSGRAQKEAAAGVGESFTCQKSPLPLSPPRPWCRKATSAQLKPSCLAPEEQEGKPDVSSCPCREVAKLWIAWVKLQPTGQLPSLRLLSTPSNVEQSREYSITSYSPDHVLVRCLCSVKLQVPLFFFFFLNLSDTCFNDFKVRIRPSVCCSCCCGEGGGCYSTPWKEMTCCFSAEGFSPLPLF